MNNAQDDVTGIFDEDGDLVVTYVCDNAWGYNPIPDGPLATTIGTLNPLRYRGYVYDSETGFYYVSSRYYDSEIGRFINADAFVTTGGLLGNNMFAYCGNNPVILYDPSGHMMVYRKVVDGGGGGSSSGATLVETIASKWRTVVNNQSESVTRKTLEDYGIGFYKGTVVIAADIIGYGSALSYGLIIMDIGCLDASNTSFSQTLNHEYGHIVHSQQIGMPAYTVTTAIPSLIFAGLSNIFPIVQENYFSLPWERVADYLGGVDRGYAPGANTCGSLFWLYTYIVGRIGKGECES